MRMSVCKLDVCSSVLSGCVAVPLHHASHFPPPHAGEDRTMIQLAAFWLFAFMVIASATMVILARNPVHSVMWLILAFFNAAGLMLLAGARRSEEHTSELQSLMRISYAVFCLKKNKNRTLN